MPRDYSVIYGFVITSRSRGVCVMEEGSMTITHSFFTGYPLSSGIIASAEQMAQRGIHAIFKARPAAITQDILGQMERRDRVVLILLDGRRTIEDVARLTHRDEIEIARILVRLLQWGYVEFLGG